MGTYLKLIAELLTCFLNSKSLTLIALILLAVPKKEAQNASISLIFFLIN